MEEMIEELAAYYGALGYPLYEIEELKKMSETEINDLYEITFPNRQNCVLKNYWLFSKLFVIYCFYPNIHGKMKQIKRGKDENDPL